MKPAAFDARVKPATLEARLKLAPLETHIKTALRIYINTVKLETHTTRSTGRTA